MVGMLRASILISAVALCAPAQAQTGSSANPEGPAQAAPAAAVTEHGVSYARVDQATVRVFAVHGAQAIEVRGQLGPRILGIPEAGHGSGVVVTDDGLILTAHHVVARARLLAVRLPGDGGLYPATVVASDEKADWAILAINGRFPHFVPLGESPPGLRVRSTVHAIGYPLDPTRRQPQSSGGTLAGTLNEGELQLAISLNPGNSGGPLIDSKERLVGIVVARGDVDKGVQGIGYAVPVGVLKHAIVNAYRNGDVAKAREHLNTYAAWGKQAARIVDVMVAGGVLGVIQDAVHGVEGTAQEGNLSGLDSLAVQLHDPQLMSLAAAVFWDAAEVVMERAGGVPAPHHLQEGPVKQQASALRDRAVYLSHAAANLDTGIYQLSPFVAHVVRNHRTPPPWPAVPPGP